jgi:hypothetical protein
MNKKQLEDICIMADYSIKSGDCLWNIAKANYNVKSNSEIQEIVNLISKENKLDNPNLIYAGASLVLPETDSFIKTTQETVGAQVAGEEKQEETQNQTVDIKSEEVETPVVEEKTKADDLQEWNSYDNSIKASMGEDIEEFQMFDAVGEGMSEKQYFEALAGFTQSVIDKYDSDADGVMNNEEFTLMATDELGIEEYSKAVATKEANFLASLMQDASLANDTALIETSAAQTAASMPELLANLFSSLQMDDDETTISLNELATQLFYADYNNQTGKYDGKIDFTAYNTYTDTSKEIKKVFYDHAKSFDE